VSIPTSVYQLRLVLAYPREAREVRLVTLVPPAWIGVVQGRLWCASLRITRSRTLVPLSSTLISVTISRARQPHRPSYRYTEIFLTAGLLLPHLLLTHPTYWQLALRNDGCNSEQQCVRHCAGSDDEWELAAATLE
jgi:hypothetical protein